MMQGQYQQHQQYTGSAYLDDPRDRRDEQAPHAGPSSLSLTPRPQPDLFHRQWPAFASPLTHSPSPSAPISSSSEVVQWPQSPLSPPFSSPPPHQRKRLRGRPHQVAPLAQTSSLPYQPADNQQRHFPSPGCSNGDSDSDDSEADRGQPAVPLRHYDPDHLRQESVGKGPVKKRQRAHLDSNDVGRFAGMNIFEDTSKEGVAASLGVPISNGPGAPPSSPRSPVGPRHAVADTNAVLPVSSSAEWPGMAHNNDCGQIEAVLQDVQMGRQPGSWPIDPHRTFIANLEEDDSNGSDAQDQSILSSEERSSNNEAITEAEAKEIATWKHRRISRIQAEEMHPGDLERASPATPTASFDINPELLAKLEAHSRSIALSGDISSRPTARTCSAVLRSAASTSDEDQTRGELVLWRSPEEILGPSGVSTPVKGKSREFTERPVPRHHLYLADTASSDLVSSLDSASSANSTNLLGDSARQSSLFSFGTSTPAPAFLPAFRYNGDDNAGAGAGAGAVMTPGRPFGQVHLAVPEAVEETMDLDD